MSRIGKKPIDIPSGVDASLAGNTFTAKGPKGTLVLTHHHEVSVEISEGKVLVHPAGRSQWVPALWGTTAKLIENMFRGVTNGFSKQLELNGVGYRMSLQGKKLVFALGFSHPVEMQVPEDIEAKVENLTLTVSGMDKQHVGQFAAEIRRLKPVEPYKGKGFRYVGEVVRLKEGKKSAA